MTPVSPALSDVQAITVTVTNTPDAPVAVNDTSFSVPEEGFLSVGAPGVKGNDSDQDTPMNLVNALLVTSPFNGTLQSFLTSGAFQYMPNVNFFGVDTFTYRLNDGTNLSNIATVSITVTNINDPPVVANPLPDAPQSGDSSAAVRSRPRDGTGFGPEPRHTPLP